MEISGYSAQLSLQTVINFIVQNIHPLSYPIIAPVRKGGQESEVKQMTETEKKILEVFERNLPQMTDEEKHDLMMMGKGMEIFMAARNKQEEPPKKAG